MANGQVLEWFGWESKYIEERLFPYVWVTPEGHRISAHQPAAYWLENVRFQARYFDPYILEKGYTNWEITKEPNKMWRCIIWGNNVNIVQGKAKTEALAKREAYIKLCEVESEA